MFWAPPKPSRGNTSKSPWDLGNTLKPILRETQVVSRCHMSTGPMLTRPSNVTWRCSWETGTNSQRNLQQKSKLPRKSNLLSLWLASFFFFSFIFGSFVTCSSPGSLCFLFVFFFPSFFVVVCLLACLFGYFMLCYVFVCFLLVGFVLFRCVCVCCQLCCDLFVVVCACWSLLFEVLVVGW